MFPGIRWGKSEDIVKEKRKKADGNLGKGNQEYILIYLVPEQVHVTVESS